MNDPEPLVIAVSINGERSKEDNPNVPRSHDEIVATALGCYEAGASILHAHNRDFRMRGAEAADDYLAAWRRVREARPDALWYPTLTGHGAQELEHFALIDEAIGLHFGIVDCGSVPFMQMSDEGEVTGRYYQNSFDQIREAFAFHERHNLGVQISVFEPQFLRIALAYHAAGKLPQGTVINFYLGGGDGAVQGSMPFGLPPTPAALEAYLDLLGDSGLPWTVSAWGSDLLKTDLPALAIEKGGHIQIGLESHFDAVDKPSNEEQVARIFELAKALGRPVADSAATLKAWRCPRDL
ncbi:MAG: 3-keto-5-aminohexanoate cleavage protein [Novosphingobium sp.]|nr:3-keto-5-aminohexanoate cleavage protein [Novosphingobium sp.]